MPSVSGGIQGRVLKSGRARTVYVDGRGALVKRFHNPGAVQALRDRARADAEHDVLAALRARHVPVPRPLEVRRARRSRGLAGGWEVVMERIPDSTTLAEVLAGTSPSPVPLPTLAARLGQLLARVHAEGLDHPDLHPGNVLVDRAGDVWLIDFHKARLRERLDASTLRRDVVSLAAAVRESMPREARARFVLAWHTNLPAPLARALARRARLAELAARIEHEARARRRAVLAHAQGRWMRSSSACDQREGERGPIYVRRGLPDAVIDAIQAHPSAKAEFALELGDGTRLDLLVLHGLSVAERHDRWYAAVRLSDHDVPCLRPLALTPRWVAFTAPPEARTGHARNLRPAALGTLLGTLHDRGLDVDPLRPADLRIATDGTLHLLPPARLHHVDARAGALPPHERFRALAGLPGASDDPHFRAAYVRAFRGDAREAQRLANEVLL